VKKDHVYYVLKTFGEKALAEVESQLLEKRPVRQEKGNKALRPGKKRA
jgi:hypothetical protein